jgi:mono/diheme cytochrome c family protein
MSTEPKDTTPHAVDDAEPTSGSSPAPVALIILFALLVYWGMLYLDDHGGGFNPRVYQPYADYKLVVDRQPVTDPLTAAMNEGGKLFNANCAVCHQANGSGGTCPPLAGSDWVAGGGPNRIIRLVLNGGGGPITVSGKPITPAGTMLAFKDTLTDKQIAAALSYVRNSWGNQASLVTPEQVAKVRDAVSSRHVPWTAPDLLAVPDKD